MKKYTLKIVTPQKVFFDGEVVKTIARTTVGDIGILAGHEPYVAELKSGKLTYVLEDESRSTAETSGGMIKVGKDGVIILVQNAE